MRMMDDPNIRAITLRLAEGAEQSREHIVSNVGDEKDDVHDARASLDVWYFWCREVLGVDVEQLDRRI